MKLISSLCTAFLLLPWTGFSQTKTSLVPKVPSKAPDYFCTWNIQGYAVSYENSDIMRGAMTEKYMLGKEKYQNWVSLYPTIRQDLIFVMDDSWDIPIDQNIKKNNAYVGSVELDTTRFPSFTGNPTERLKKLTDCVKLAGWKGLGGWICAQKAINRANVSEKDYWIERLKAAEAAGFSYWKIDWGQQARNDDWRRMISALGKQYAPHVFLENAMKNEYIEFSDAIRTYDVENIIAQPVTIRRICDLLPYKTANGAKGLINCEDEPYIAAGLGCAIGVMRHPFVGNLPDGKKDDAFPSVGRNIKKRLDEVVRGIRWHRIAEPFGVGGVGTYHIDTIKLKDYWVLGERETWNKAHKTGDTLREIAPARVSRELPLATVINPTADQPFVLSSMYPNGAIAIVTIGRGLNHDYITRRVNIEQSIKSIVNPIGIFGDYESLTLVLPTKVKASDYQVLGQDLAGDTPLDITKDIVFTGNKIIIPGAIIRKVGLSAASKDDLSDPGMVLKFVRI